MTRKFLVLDLGTTSLAGRLIDESGQFLAEEQLLNPQSVFGADVLRRLQVARDGQGEQLQSLLVEGINDISAELLKQAGLKADSITTAAAVANPAISIMLQNLPTEPVLFPPYRPQSCEAAILSPGSFGFDLPVPLFLFPLVNGFVGGDLVAFLFGQEEPAKSTLYIDIGTNGEIALYTDGQWSVTSVAAGPAFEGGEIGSGMLYGAGAIKGVNRDGDRFVYDVVGALPPHGICGSGLAEMIAAALEAGLIDRHGSIVDSDEITTNLAHYIIPAADGFSLQLHRDANSRILLEQKDVRNFQLAKAAIHAGVECLLARAGVEVEEIAEVVLTGAFGFSLSKKTLKRVAMLPESMVDKVRFEPSGALNGVCRMLTLGDGQERVEKLAKELKPYPLSGTPAFEKAFIKSIDF